MIANQKSRYFQHHHIKGSPHTTTLPPLGKAVETVEGAQIVIRTRPVVAVVVVAVELDVGAAVSMLAFMVVLSSVKEAA